ncbi:MAG TPA: tyrosine-type recombinase/integrase [Gammaproteobacteria bacterium]|nr:tyrosine-type recombinase/integrase [Gammaproteobacteria bacterium]
MLTALFPKYHRRYLESPVADWLVEFADWLVAAGYARDPAHAHVRRLKQALEARGSVTPEAEFSVAELTTMFTSPRGQPLFRATQRVFERFLAGRGRLTVEPDPNRFRPLLDAYRRYLNETRGLAAGTISQHLTTVSVFLDEAVPPDASLHDLAPQAVEQFVIAAAQRLKRQSLQHTVAQLRAFLRFCHDSGELRERLDIIDTPRTYRDELPPRALAWDLVQKLLRSIDRSHTLGCRDHAILYLMAHYGLRPSEIVCLTLDSIDWANKTLRVEQRKTRSMLVLPLSDQALRVLKRYLRCGRPGSARPQLFLRGRSPAGSLKHTAVCSIYENRARRSGLPLQGSSSYSLRHAFAMRLLERGVGIKVIGDLLGHHTLESTCVYLRLQTEALREVGLPLPRVTVRGPRRPS